MGMSSSNLPMSSRIEKNWRGLAAKHDPHQVLVEFNLKLRPNRAMGSAKHLHVLCADNQAIRFLV